MTEISALNKALGAWGENIGLRALKDYYSDDWGSLGYKVSLNREAPYPIHRNPHPYDGYMTMTAVDFEDKNEFLVEVKTNGRTEGEYVFKISVDQMDRYNKISKDIPIDYIFVYVDTISRSIYKVSQNNFIRHAEVNNSYYSYVVCSDDIIGNIQEDKILDIRMKMKRIKDNYSKSLFD